MRRRVKLIIGVVVTLALLICGVTYLLLIEWPSIKSPPQGVETELLRSGEPTRTVWLGEYSYEVRFHNATGGEAAVVGASIQYGGPPQVGYRLTVSLSHPIETWYIMVDGLGPSTTHLESLSLTFNFSRPIETLPFPWLLPPIRPTQFPSNISSSFSLESRIVDVERGVLLLNFSRLRDLEVPLMGDVRWSWISFEFLMGPSPETGHFDAFTLTISFTLQLPSGGKIMYEKGTTTLDFQPPVGAALQEADPLVFHPLTTAIPRRMARSSIFFSSYYS